MRRFLAITILAAMLLGLSLVFAFAETNFKSEFQTVENLGDPIVSIAVLNSVATVEDGKPVLCQTVGGDPAILNIIDLQNNKLIRSFEVPIGKNFWTMEADSKGNVYFAGYTTPNLYKYSPVEKKLIDLGPCSGEGAILQIAIDNEDNVFMGTYPNAKLLKYDVKTNKMMDFGKMFTDAIYFKSLVYADGYLYGGSLSATPSFVKINAKTMKKEVIPNPNLNGITLKSYYSGTKAGTKIFYWCETSGQNVNKEGFIGGYVVFDTLTGKFLDKYIPNGRGLYTTPEINGYCYLPLEKNIYKYNLKTDEYEITSIPYTTGFRCDSFIKIDNWPEFPNGAFINCFYGGGAGVYDFETGKQVSVNAKIKGSANPLVGIKTVGDYVWVSGHMGPVAVKYDPNKKEVVTSFSMAQSTAITEIDGKVYFGSYPSASMSVFDPNKPIIAKENPKELYNVLQFGQSRMMRIQKAGEKIVMTSIADYNKLQGAMTLYDPVTGTVECLDNIVKDQGITSVLYKDGIIYGASTIYGGLGSIPTQSAAKIYKYDMSSKKVIKEVTPVLESVEGSPKVIGDLKFGPDGLIWTVTDGVVYAFDPDTLEVKKEVSVFGMNDSYYKGRVDPYSLAFDSKGILYCNPRQTLVAIDTNTLEHENLLPESFDRVTRDINLDEKDNIYFFSNTSLYRLKKIQSNDRVVLMLNKTKTNVNGTVSELDVAATTKNDRTVVPARFIAEAFKAKVDWDEATQTVSIIKDETNIKVKLGSNILIKNGVEITLDVAAFTENGRTLLPLRAISEALDKKVFWDNRGLIILSDETLTLTSDQVTEYVNMLN